MNSRRKFVKEGALAATALLALRPFQSLANLGAGFAHTGIANPHLVFLHTAESGVSTHGRVYQYMSGVRQSGVQPILLHAALQTETSAEFDVKGNEETFAGEYHILTRNGIKTGVIRAAKDVPGEPERVNRVAAYLKQNLQCQFVVCLSFLGYKSKSGPDDRQLAAGSEHIDLIIGGDMTNCTAYTRTIPNRNRQEVLVQSSLHHSLPCGKLEITFDERQSKRHIHVATRLYKDAAALQA